MVPYQSRPSLVPARAGGGARRPHRLCAALSARLYGLHLVDRVDQRLRDRPEAVNSAFSTASRMLAHRPAPPGPVRPPGPGSSARTGASRRCSTVRPRGFRFSWTASPASGSTINQAHPGQGPVDVPSRTDGVAHVVQAVEHGDQVEPVPGTPRPGHLEADPAVETGSPVPAAPARRSGRGSRSRRRWNAGRPAPSTGWWRPARIRRPPPKLRPRSFSVTPSRAGSQVDSRFAA